MTSKTPSILVWTQDKEENYGWKILDVLNRLQERHTSVNTILLQEKSNVCHVKHINLHIYISEKPSNLTATTEVDWASTLLLPTTYTIKNVNTVDMK